MSKVWFCLIGDREYGPLEDNKLIRLAQTGRVTETTPLRKGQDGEWVAADQVRGLFPTKVNSELSANPPPLPAESANESATASPMRSSSADTSRRKKQQSQQGLLSVRETSEQVLVTRRELSDRPSKIWQSLRSCTDDGRMVVTALIVVGFLWVEILNRGLSTGMFYSFPILFVLTVVVLFCRRMSLMPSFGFDLGSTSGWIVLLSWAVAIKLSIALFGPLLMILVVIWTPSDCAAERIRNSSAGTRWVMLGLMFALVCVTVEIERWKKQFATPGIPVFDRGTRSTVATPSGIAKPEFVVTRPPSSSADKRNTSAQGTTQSYAKVSLAHDMSLSIPTTWYVFGNDWNELIKKSSLILRGDISGMSEKHSSRTTLLRITTRSSQPYGSLAINVYHSPLAPPEIIAELANSTDSLEQVKQALVDEIVRQTWTSLVGDPEICLLKVDGHPAFRFSYQRKSILRGSVVQVYLMRVFLDDKTYSITWSYENAGEELLAPILDACIESISIPETSR